MVLECSDTRDKARFVLRVLLGGEKTKVQIVNAVLDEFLDDAYVKHIMADLEAEGYIECALGKWIITSKGEHYVRSYDNMVTEGVLTYLSATHAKTDARKVKELREEHDRKFNRNTTIIAVMTGLLSVIIAIITLLISKEWRELLLRFLE